MAALPNATVVTAEEYLASTYRPDLEYADQTLVERSVPNVLDGLLALIVAEHFRRHRATFHYDVLSEVRTQIIERMRYRIPDVLLCPLPLPKSGPITTVPWVVIEVLPPDDALKDMFERFRDFTVLGVHQIVLLDPHTSVAHRFENGSLIATQFTGLQLPTGTVPFDTDALFQQFAAELAEGA